MNKCYAFVFLFAMAQFVAVKGDAAADWRVELAGILDGLSIIEPLKTYILDNWGLLDTPEGGKIIITDMVDYLRDKLKTFIDSLTTLGICGAPAIVQSINDSFDRLDLGILEALKEEARNNKNWFNQDGQQISSNVITYVAKSMTDFNLLFGRITGTVNAINAVPTTGDPVADANAKLAILFYNMGILMKRGFQEIINYTFNLGTFPQIPYTP